MADQQEEKKEEEKPGTLYMFFSNGMLGNEVDF